MDQVASILEQLRLFTMQHAPGGMPTGAIPVALILLVAGIALSVLGAKFARFALTSAFVVMGGAFGDQFAQNFDFPRTLCIPVGAALIGIIGFQTFRVWVGVAVAMLLCATVVSGFSANRVLPHLSEYTDTSSPLFGQPTPSGETEFLIPTPAEQAAHLNRNPRTWFSNFWTFLTERDPNVARNTQAIAILSALGGLCLGLMAVRPSLIISTSLIGTTMVVAGLGTLLSSSVPSAYTSVQSNPRLIGLGVAAFLATSLLLQTMLMRKSTVGGPKPAKA
jgi:hypothetical protein